MRNDSGCDGSTGRGTRWKKILCRMLIALGIAVILLVLPVLGLKRPQSVPVFPDGEENRHIAVVTAKLWNAVGTGSRNELPKITIELTEGEINALLNIAIRAWQFRHGRPDDPVLEGVWRAGAAHVAVSLPITGKLAVNASSRVVPHLEARRLTIATAHNYAGWLPLPAAVVDGQVREALKRVEEEPYYQLLLEILLEVRVLENGNLAVTLDPRRAGYLIQLLRSR